MWLQTVLVILYKVNWRPLNSWWNHNDLFLNSSIATTKRRWRRWYRASCGSYWIHWNRSIIDATATVVSVLRWRTPIRPDTAPPFPDSAPGSRVKRLSHLTPMFLLNPIKKEIKVMKLLMNLRALNRWITNCVCLRLVYQRFIKI